MAVQDALQFIALAGTDAELRRVLAEGRDCLDLDALVTLGTERGLEFTADEFVAAFARDSEMRRHFAGP